MSNLPLPILWSTPIPWNGFLWHTPVVRDDEVAVRAGLAIAGLATADGTLRWRRELPGSGVGGQLFTMAGALALADVRIDDLLHVVAVGDDGERWRVPLPGGLERAGWVQDEGSLTLVSRTPGNDSTLVSIRLADGTATRRDLAPGSVSLTRHRGALLVGVPGAVDRTGAYVADDPTRALRQGDVWTIEACGDHVVTVGRRRRDAYELQLHADGHPEPRWQAETFTGCAALDDHHVVHAERDGQDAVLVLRDLGGAVVWRRSIGTEHRPTTLSFAGPLVLVRHSAGILFLRRSDGHLLGDATGCEGYRAAMDGDRLYLGDWRAVVAAQLPG